MKRIEDYSGEEVFYDDQKVEGKYALVSVRVKTRKNTEIPVEYRMKQKDGEWLIYDATIEGVSLVNNYRKQFNAIILKSSYEDLVKRLKEKETLGNE